jgi:hypothetical protein
MRVSPLLTGYINYPVQQPTAATVWWFCEWQVERMAVKIWGQLRRKSNWQPKTCPRKPHFTGVSMLNGECG